MAETAESASLPSWRKIAATIAIVFIVVAVWAVIEYRQRPSPPPHKVGEQVQNR